MTTGRDVHDPDRSMSSHVSEASMSPASSSPNGGRRPPVAGEVAELARRLEAHCAGPSAGGHRRARPRSRRGPIAGGGGALHVGARDGPVRVHIELEPARPLGCRFGDGLHRPVRQRREDERAGRRRPRRGPRPLRPRDGRRSCSAVGANPNGRQIGAAEDRRARSERRTRRRGSADSRRRDRNAASFVGDGRLVPPAAGDVVEAGRRAGRLVPPPPGGQPDGGPEVIHVRSVSDDDEPEAP